MKVTIKDFDNIKILELYKWENIFRNTIIENKKKKLIN